jgi:ArsR family transcriptional regulator
MKKSTVSPCCPPVFEGHLRKLHAEKLAVGFKALADPTRLLLLNFIAAQPSGEACVCHLTEPTGLSQPTISHHLKLLSEAGLLDHERRGTWVYYRLVPDQIAALQEALAAPAKTKAEEARSAGRRSRA